MPYYHVQITFNKLDSLGKFHSETEYELDLSEEEAGMLGNQYGTDRVFFKGKWVDTSIIQEIEIRETREKTTAYFPELYYSRIFRSSEFPNVTRSFIKSPPQGQTTSAKSERPTQPLSKNIFIVHGRDHGPMNDLKTMLYEFNLHPIVLHEQPSGSRTIVEKLEKHSDVGFAFVILTPDDMGHSTDLFLPRVSGRPRARQNVILEFGYFMGLLGRDRVCCLYKGDIELPSDMSGIVYVSFKDSVEELRVRIMKELTQAGYEIKL